MSQKRVLIIEDDPAFARWISDCLPGCERITVDKCDDARAHLSANRFDVVILDWSMASHESQSWLRALAPNAAIVVITGNAACLPNWPDAAEWKINLNSSDAMAGVVYDAIRSREKTPGLSRAVESVVGCAYLMKGAVA